MALKNLGLIIFIDLLRTNREMFKEYEKEKDDLIDDVLKGTIVINTPQAEKEIEERFGAIFNKYFINGFKSSQLLVDKEVAVISDALKVPFRYNRDVIDLVNERSVFRGFADDLYKERFTRGEVDRIKKVLLSGTYNQTDEKLIRDELQKKFNLTKKRAQLLARSETKRLRETTKSVYYAQEEVQKQYELVWDAMDDGAVRPSHAAMDGKVADENGYFDSADFGRVPAPPLEFNCRCTTFFRKK